MLSNLFTHRAALTKPTVSPYWSTDINLRSHQVSVLALILFSCHGQVKSLLTTPWPSSSRCLRSEMGQGRPSPSRRWTSMMTGSSPGVRCRWVQICNFCLFLIIYHNFCCFSQCFSQSDWIISCSLLARWKNTWGRSLNVTATLPTTPCTRTWWKIFLPKKIRTKMASYPPESLLTSTMNFKATSCAASHSLIQCLPVFINVW